MANNNLNIEESFKQKLQFVYGKTLEENGIKFGDIDPPTLVRLEEAENKLAEIVGEWIRSGKGE